MCFNVFWKDRGQLGCRLRGWVSQYLYPQSYSVRRLWFYLSHSSNIINYDPNATVLSEYEILYGLNMVKRHIGRHWKQPKIACDTLTLLTFFVRLMTYFYQARFDWICLLNDPMGFVCWTMYERFSFFDNILVYMEFWLMFDFYSSINIRIFVYNIDWTTI